MQQGEKYDVTVIGAGIGGLCTGALLSCQGYKVMVVEKLNRIGGRCSTEEYEGFKLPTGAAAIHRGAGMDETFRQAGTQLEIIMVPRLLYRLGGEDYEMPIKGSITAMFDIINKLEVNRTKFTGGLVKAIATEKLGRAMGRGFHEPEKETMVFRDWLLQYTDNEIAHGIFDTIASVLLAAHTFEIPASSVFSFFAIGGGSRDVGIAPHGNLAEMEKLAKVIKSNHGDIWTGCEVKSITISGDKTSGIVVRRNGDEVEISSQVVISDIGPKRTSELAQEKDFDDDYLRLLRLRNRRQPVTVVFIASDVPLWPESGKAEAAIGMLTGTRRIKSIIPLSSISPELAPPGQHLLFLYCAPRTSFQDHIDAEEEERQVIMDIKEQLPLFEKHGRILKLDPRDIDHEFPGSRCRIGSGMPVETPVKNLYNVGDGCNPPGITGTTGAVGSARRVIDIIKKTYKPGKP